VLELLLVDLELDGLGVLVLELLAQRVLLGLMLLQLGPLLAPHEEVHQRRGEHDEGEPHRLGADRQRPPSRVARVKRLDLFPQVHCRAPESSPRLALRILLRAAPAPLPLSLASAAGASSAVSVKLEPGPLPVCTTSSSGLRSHCEASMLRMKVETRVLDCATPSNFRRLTEPLPICCTPVRYTPSGSVFTI